MPVKEIYKEHEITAAARYVLDSAQWKPIVMIAEMKTCSVFAPSINLLFRGEPQAMLEAPAFAKKWIDDGKPPLKE